MNQILPHVLWIGHAGDGRDPRRLFDAEIKAVVELAAEEEPSHPPRELIYCRFPLVDGVGNDPELLYLAISTVANLLERRVATLVCCGSGLSRSPAISAAALSIVYQESPEDCLRRVAEHHPHDVAAGLWNEVAGLLASDRFFGT